MPKTLIISFLPREESNTRKLLDVFRKTAADKTEFIERNLDEKAVPLLNTSAMKTWWGPAAENEVETASKEFIQELKSADFIIVATPMYNWSLPAPVKAWFDLVIRGGQTFEFGPEGAKGLLESPKAALFVTSGMTALESGADHLTPVVKTGLGLMGASETAFVGASELLIVGDDEAAVRMNSASQAATQLAENWYN
jgi:FMN-dependent NADH-azoreductase